MKKPVNEICFDKNGWQDYLFWQKQDKKTLKRINDLIKDIMRSPFEGAGKPEALKGDLSGFFSRRIDECNRLVYKIEGCKVIIIQCRYHY